MQCLANTLIIGPLSSEEKTINLQEWKWGKSNLKYYSQKNVCIHTVYAKITWQFISGTVGWELSEAFNFWVRDLLHRASCCMPESSLQSRSKMLNLLIPERHWRQKMIVYQYGEQTQLSFTTRVEVMIIIKLVWSLLASSKEWTSLKHNSFLESIFI